LNFLCDEVSDDVFRCLGFREIIKGGLGQFLCKRMHARIHGTAPVFGKLCIHDWNLSLDGDDFVKYIGDGNVFNQTALFSFSPLGLKHLEIKYSKSLNNWLNAVPWPQLAKYFENARNLESVVIGASGNQNAMNDASEPYDYNKLREFNSFFFSLVRFKRFLVESSPKPIDVGYITSLSSFISDLQVYDRQTVWNEHLIKEIMDHFGSLQRFGFPANKMNMPAFVNCMEGKCNDVVIRSLDRRNAKTLQPQDLAMLFSRFQRIEIDASLIDKYPKNIHIHAKIQKLSIRADSGNFFIKLLRNIPGSVNHLSITNQANATNNLVIDVSQKDKFMTKNIRTLELNGFENNLRQITTLMKLNIFQNLTRLNVIAKAKKIRNMNIRQEVKDAMRHKISVNIICR